MHWGEYQRLKGTMSGEKEQKGVARWKADTYQLRINIHFKTSVNKTRDFETGGVASILYSIFVSSFYQPLRSMVSFILNQEFFKGGGWVVGKHYNRSLSTLLLEKGLPDCKIYSTLSLKKDYLIARLSSFLQQQLAVKSITAFGEKGHEQSRMIFFLYNYEANFCATWRCISFSLYEMIFDFLKTFFIVGERLSYSVSHFFLRTVSILEQRLTMTENKLRECLDNQQKITLQIRPNE